MTTTGVVSERTLARQIAENWLDFKLNTLTHIVHGDRDCDACMLARQFVLVQGELEHMRMALINARDSLFNGLEHQSLAYKRATAALGDGREPLMDT